MIALSLSVSLVVMAAAPEPPMLQPAAATEATFVIKVADKDKTTDLLIQKAEAMGGYFTNRNEQQVTLRVPANEERALIKAVEEAGILLTRDYRKTDLSEPLEAARARVKTIEGMMKRYLETLAQAGPNQVVVVEREVVALIGQLEEARRMALQMERRLATFELVVSFQYHERRAPARDGRSSFAWINTVNLADLLEDFRHAH